MPVKAGYNLIHVDQKVLKNSVLLVEYVNNMLGVPSDETNGIMSDIYLTSMGQISSIGFKYNITVHATKTAYIYNQSLTNQFTTNGTYNVSVVVSSLNLTAYAPVIINMGKLHFPMKVFFFILTS